MRAYEKLAEDKTARKLLEDPNSLSTTMLINPEILGEMSPTLPKKFPKELIPKEICEGQLNKLTSCLVDNEFNNVDCEDFQFKFYECKKWRDALLFKRIKEWELKEYDRLNEEDKLYYVNELKIKKIEFINEYEKIEVTPRNRGKRIRYSSDIEQIDWRIKYLEYNKKEFNI